MKIFHGSINCSKEISIFIHFHNYTSLPTNKTEMLLFLTSLLAIRESRGIYKIPPIVISLILAEYYEILDAGSASFALIAYHFLVYGVEWIGDKTWRETNKLIDDKLEEKIQGTED